MGSGATSAPGFLRVLRLFRLTRMARMARLLRACPELFDPWQEGGLFGCQWWTVDYHCTSGERLATLHDLPLPHYQVSLVNFLKFIRARPR